ncbi:hypothetical protein GCM10009827_048100 [Dactylosporangium maewongense]|uniref:Uncharacterized protein n=1 Tax=Dactylosporangium maewongense TaxID=634393 RepID=A0ABN2AUX2_9ACTN
MPSGPFTVDALAFGDGFPAGDFEADGPADGDTSAVGEGSADAVAEGAPVAGRAAWWSCFLSDPHAVRASIEAISSVTTDLRRGTLNAPYNKRQNALPGQRSRIRA